MAEYSRTRRDTRVVRDRSTGSRPSPTPSLAGLATVLQRSIGNHATAAALAQQTALSGSHAARTAFAPASRRVHTPLPARVLQRLPIHQATVGHRYRYLHLVEEPIGGGNVNRWFEHRIGTLARTYRNQNGGWFRFSESEYDIHANDVVEDLGPSTRQEVQARRQRLVPTTRAILELVEELELNERAALFASDTGDELLAKAIEFDNDDQAAYDPSTLRLADVGVASCYNAATILFNRLATEKLTAGVANATGFEGAPVIQPPPVDRDQPAEQQAAARQAIAAAPRQNVARLRTTCDDLRDALRAVAVRGNGAIFAVSFGIHGFTIVVRQGRCELLPSFAGPSGQSVASYLRDNVRLERSFPVELVCSQLREMIAAPQNNTDRAVEHAARTRLRAQSLLFGALAESPDFRLSPFQWTRGDLRPPEGIKHQVRDWVDKSLAFFETVRLAQRTESLAAISAESTPRAAAASSSSSSSSRRTRSSVAAAGDPSADEDAGGSTKRQRKEKKEKF